MTKLLAMSVALAVIVELPKLKKFVLAGRLLKIVVPVEEYVKDTAPQLSAPVAWKLSDVPVEVHGKDCIVIAAGQLMVGLTVSATKRKISSVN